MTTESEYMSRLYKGYMLPPDKMPLIVSNTILAGYLFGDAGLAVVSFLMPVFFLFETFGYWINYGAFASSLGAVSRNETELARSYSSLALILSLTAGVILSAAAVAIFPSLLRWLEVPSELLQLAEDYGLVLALSGVSLLGASYCWQFVKMIGLQARVRRIYVIIMLFDVLAVMVCVKLFSLGIAALSTGMILTELFIIFVTGSWLRESFRQNLFGRVRQPLRSVLEIFLAGSVPAVGKFYSLLLVYIFNLALLKTYGVEGVAVFATIQMAIRICRLHSQVTWQPLLPILTMEYADRNAPAMALLLKHSFKQAIFMAALPALVIYFGAEYFASSLPMKEFAVDAFRTYSLSVVFAAVNSIFIIAYSVMKFNLLANVMEFLRSLALILLFIEFVEPERIFWAFLFSEVVTLVLLAAVSKLKAPLLPETPSSVFVVVNRQKETFTSSAVDGRIAELVNSWLKIVKQFSDTGKGDFTAIHVLKGHGELRITLRSVGRLFDYSSNEQALEFVNRLEALISYKFTYTLGLNNLYLRLKWAD